MLMAAFWYHFSRRFTGNFIGCYRDEKAKPQRQRASTPRGRELGQNLSLHLWVPSILRSSWNSLLLLPRAQSMCPSLPRRRELAGLRGWTPSSRPA